MENKQATLELGTKPVGKLLVQYALPAMIAMTAASLYNIVDRVFIGQVWEQWRFPVWPSPSRS